MKKTPLYIEKIIEQIKQDDGFNIQVKQVLASGRGANLKLKKLLETYNLTKGKKSFTAYKYLKNILQRKDFYTKTANFSSPHLANPDFLDLFFKGIGGTTGGNPIPNPFEDHFKNFGAFMGVILLDGTVKKYDITSIANASNKLFEYLKILVKKYRQYFDIKTHQQSTIESDLFTLLIYFFRAYGDLDKNANPIIKFLEYNIKYTVDIFLNRLDYYIDKQKYPNVNVFSEFKNIKSLITKNLKI